MNKKAIKLKKLTAEFADSDRPVTSYHSEMTEYIGLVRHIADTHSGFASQKQSGSHSLTPTGVAIDPWLASLSLEDRGRTVAFIRGCVRAVERVLKSHPQRPVHLVEAGCGPFATLSLPLMARFGPDQLQVSLIDLHQESIDTAKYVIGELGLSDGLRDAVCGDLMEMGDTTGVDIVVLETMYAALFHEPQVALTRHLVRAFPSALIVPEVISIDLQLIDLGLECSTVPLQARNRKNLGRVFNLDHASALSIQEDNGYLPAATLRIPKSIDSHYTLCLTTSMVIFDDVSLADYDADITAPIGIPIDPAWFGNDLRFKYRLNEYPGLDWEAC